MPERPKLGPEPRPKMRKCPYCHLRRREGEKCCNPNYIALEGHVTLSGGRAEQRARGIK